MFYLSTRLMNQKVSALAVEILRIMLELLLRLKQSQYEIINLSTKSLSVAFLC